MEKLDPEFATGKDFQFLITGNFDVFDKWDEIMTPNSLVWSKIRKNNWDYYIVGDDEFNYSVEPPGIQMVFNKEISYIKARQIANEIIENIKFINQDAELVIISSNSIYSF